MGEMVRGKVFVMASSLVCASSSPCVGEHILGDEDSGLGLC